MNNQEYILKSELDEIIHCIRTHKFLGDEKVYIDKEELLSELDNLSGVSGWIPVTEKNKFEI